MIVNDPFESYTMVYGFFMSNRIWDLMLATGVAYAPIAWLVASSVWEAYHAAESDGSRSMMALKKIELGIIRILLVISLFLMPTGKLFNVTKVDYTSSSCNSVGINALDRYLQDGYGDAGLFPVKIISNILSSGDGLGAGSQFNISINGVNTSPPLAIEFIQQSTAKSVNAITSTIPCESDVVGIGAALLEIRAVNKDAEDYLHQFIRQCYNPSLSFELNKGLPKSEIIDFWLGSDALMEGQYIDRRMRFSNEQWHQLTHKFSLTGNIYNGAINASENGIASPQCSDGYRVLTKFIERDYADEIKNMKSDYFQLAWSKLANAYKNIVGNESSNTRELDTIVKGLTHTATHQNFKTFESDEKSLTAELIRSGGQSYALISSTIESSFAKSASAPILALIQSIFFMVIPVLLLLSGYSFKIVGMICVTVFGLEFTNVILESVKWFDNTLMSLLAASYSFGDATGYKNRVLIQNVINMMYIIAPMIWFTLLGTVGFGAGNIVSQGLSRQASAGGATANKAAAAATKIKK